MGRDLLDELDVGFATTAEGARLAYGVIGTGPRDIFMFGSTWLSFEASMESQFSGWWWTTLAALGRVIAVDLRGVGQSDPLSSELTGEDRVKEAVAVLDAAGASRVDLVGISAGGGCALQFADLYPDRVDSVIVCDSWARYRSDVDYSCGADPDAVHRILRLSERWGTGELLASGHAAGSDPSIRKAAARLERMSNSAAAHAAVQTLLQDFDLRDRLPAIEVPVLVLERPGMMPDRMGCGEDLVSRLQHATYVDIGPNLRWSDNDFGPREVARFLTGRSEVDPPQRVLTSVLVTDIVGSTEQATVMGDGPWRRLLDEHDRIVCEAIEAAGGRVVKSTGDGALAIVPGATQAFRGAQRIGRALTHMNVAIRCGIHVGEVEMRGDDIGGVAVHLAARVAGLAEAGEILATATAAGAVAGSGLSFESAGTHVLKGLPGQWELVRLCAKPT